MRWMKPIGLMIAVFALLTMSVTGAAAQPTLSGGANGATISVQWTPVPGAISYNIVVTGAVSIDASVPASPTAAVATSVPPGTYNIRVRALGGGLASPFSNEVSVTVGGGAAPPPGGCAPVAAPTLTVTTNGTAISASWNAVAGASGYRLQIGNFPGGTIAQIDLQAGQTSYTQAGVPVGTYYARVLAANACLNLTPSAEQSVTVGAATPGPTPPPTPGTGNRTPNPTATNGGVPCIPGRPDLGFCIPVAALGYASGVVNAVARANPFDVYNSCHADGGNMLFMFKAVQALRRIDERWALNLKRGNQGLSEDILAYNPTDRPDEGESQIYLFDVIGGHCGPNPQVNGLGDVTGATWNAGLNNTPGCSTRFCAAWTLQGYRQAGFTP